MIYICRTKANYMTIPKDLLDTWAQLKTHGDIEAIAERAGVTRATVTAVFKNGRANDELFLIIAEYYSDKQERFSNYLNDYSE